MPKRLHQALATTGLLLSLSACSGQGTATPATSTTPSAAASSASTPMASPSSMAPSPTPEATASPTPEPTPSASEDPGGTTAKDGVQAEDGVVDGEDVARSVSEELTKIVGRSPDSVTCDDLPAKVGAKIRCKLLDGADVYGVTVTATSVRGSNVNFNILVDDQPE